ncbi:hypothetical protein WS91_27865 [Burkholderia sp. MSMB1498]|nr:hypothetical protein WS91_27865 [Burkholderia sp. MSMB1498]
MTRRARAMRAAPVGRLRLRVARMSHACRTHVARMSHACRTHVARMSHACRTHVARMSHACRTHVARMSHACRTHVARMSHADGARRARGPSASPPLANWAIPDGSLERARPILAVSPGPNRTGRAARRRIARCAIAGDAAMSQMLTPDTKPFAYS